MSHPLPTDRTLAFAAAIISSKPPDLSVRGKNSLTHIHPPTNTRPHTTSKTHIPN